MIKKLLVAWGLSGLFAVANLAAQCPAAEYADAKEMWQVKTLPEFPDGGDPALFQFVARLALPGLPQGTAPIFQFRIQFVVEKDGTIGRICALENPEHPWTQALLQHLALSPTWKPGMIGEEAVPVRYVFPLRLHTE